MELLPPLQRPRPTATPGPWSNFLHFPYRSFHAIVHPLLLEPTLATTQDLAFQTVASAAFASAVASASASAIVVASASAVAPASALPSPLPLP